VVLFAFAISHNVYLEFPICLICSGVSGGLFSGSIGECGRAAGTVATACRVLIWSSPSSSFQSEKEQVGWAGLFSQIAQCADISEWSQIREECKSLIDCHHVIVHFVFLSVPAIQSFVSFRVSRTMLSAVRWLWREWLAPLASSILRGMWPSYQVSLLYPINILFCVVWFSAVGLCVVRWCHVSRYLSLFHFRLLIDLCVQECTLLSSRWSRPKPKSFTTIACCQPIESPRKWTVWDISGCLVSSTSYLFFVDQFYPKNCVYFQGHGNGLPFRQR